LEHNEREARELTASLEAQNEAFAAKREKEMAVARQQALSIVESVRASANLMLDEIEEAKRSENAANAKSMRSRMNAALNKLHDEANPVESSAPRKVSSNSRPAKLYDSVTLLDTGKVGTVITAPDSKGNCTVQVGIVKMKTNIANLQLAEKKSETSGGVRVSSKPAVSSGRSFTECDIRGKTADEGLAALGMFIDSCVMNHIPSATIIHGKGTGVLRRAVHDELRRDKRVREYRLGKFGEGEDGVTIVSF